MQCGHIVVHLKSTLLSSDFVKRKCKCRDRLQTLVCLKSYAGTCFCVGCGSLGAGVAMLAHDAPQLGTRIIF